MKINRKTVSEFRNDYADAVKCLEEKYGVKISLGNINYNDEYFSGKMTVEDLASKKSPEEEFKENAKYLEYLGIHQDMYGKVFLSPDNGKEYRLIGLRMNARKNFCLVQDVVSQDKYVCAPKFLGIAA